MSGVTARSVLAVVVVAAVALPVLVGHAADRASANQHRGFPETSSQESPSRVSTRQTRIPRAVRNELRANLLRRVSLKLLKKSCRATRSFEHQIGSTPLDDPSLRPAFVCMFHVKLAELLSDVADELMPAPASVTAIVAFTEAPANTTAIAYQPGLGLDRVGIENRVPTATGEGLVRVPNDLFFFVLPPARWAPTPPRDGEFAASSIPQGVWGFIQPEMRMQGVIIEEGLVTPDTIVNLQLFGRRTPAGQMPSPDDPAASFLVPLGPLGSCVESSGPFTPCGAGPRAGRFRVEVAGAELDVEEPAPGDFWFFDRDNIELVVKVLDACESPVPRYQVFAGGLTDVEYGFTLTDDRGNTKKVYAVGGSTPVVFDNEAFATCPE
jgi:hypothetical protein